jgi:hypothetical protein
MRHPKNLSPEDKFLRIIWTYTTLVAAEAVIQVRWITTGIALLLGLLIGNLKSLYEVEYSAHLRFGICALALSLLSGVICVNMASVIQTLTKVGEQLASELESPDSEEIMKEMTITPELLFSKIYEPFRNPLRWLLYRTSRKSAAKTLSFERGNIRRIEWMIYLSITQTIAALLGIMALATGLKS